jgi:glycosyltransferase involved in cell wall biosynthesis
LADAYVTPYRAEGFNLPALESQTCGTPVIATSGGATDDFLYGRKYTPIDGKYLQNKILKDDLSASAYIEPDIDCLVEILKNIERKDFSELSVESYSWFKVTDLLCKLLA